MDGKVNGIMGQGDEMRGRRLIGSIAIDAGHGGSDPGAIARAGGEARSGGETRVAVSSSSNPGNKARAIARGGVISRPGGYEILEKDLNLRLGAEIFGQAIEAGLDAYMLRGGDYDMALGRRTELANGYGVDLFLSVHHNGAASAGASGTETFHFPGSEAGQVVARAVQEAMVDRLRLPDRGVKTSDRFHVLRATRMAAVLIEPLFLTGDRDQELLEDGGYFRELARAVIGGIIGGRR